MPLAFSIHNFISSVGADAGFAAIIGLAILVLLYFAHARETANLREEAAILAERLQQAEARVAELMRPQPVTSAAPAAEGVQVTDQRGAGAATPFAPAGAGAPALASATRVVPLPEPAVGNGAPASPEPAVAMAGAAAPAPAAAAAARPATSAATVGGSPPTSPPPTPPPASIGGSGGGSSRPRAAVPGPATAAGANGGPRGGAAPAGASTAPGISRGPAAGMRQLPPLAQPARSRAGTGRRVAVALAALVLVAAVVVALIVLTRSGGSSPRAANQTPTTNAPVPPARVGFTPASVTVAVLNGTATNQLAHRVAARLASSGYHDGRVATAANQTQSSTIVAYLPGAKNRADALHVATALNLKPTAVQPIDQATQQVACPPPGTCSTNVVVTVGADLATF